MASMKESLGPVGMLDQHQIAGIFVNWWDGVKYDLKTIMQHGWDVDLIYPEASDLIIEKFFPEKQSEIDTLKEQLESLQMTLDELVEKALEITEYEPEEPEDGQEGKEPKHTPKLAYAQLQQSIQECTEKDTEEKATLEKCLSDLQSADAAQSEANSVLKKLTDDLNRRVELKCHGVADKQAELQMLIRQTKNEMHTLFIDACTALDNAKIQYPNKGMVSINALQEFFNKVKGGVEGQLKKFENILSNFIDAVAVLIVTTCVIPILVLLILLMLVRQFFGAMGSAPEDIKKLKETKNAIIKK